ncbi:MAG: PhoU domain-containing protein [Candidatus Aenigmatarchaeota archaeon]
MVEERKIQKTGGSTYIVSLPKDWAKGKIEEGDSVFLEGGENSLKINLREDEENKKEIEIKYDSNLDSLLRKIIARYLVGYDEIRIVSDEVIRNREEVEQTIREKMMGVEVTNETAKEIEFQNLLKYSDLPTKKVMKRMNSIIEGMYADIIDSFVNYDGEILRDIIKRENELDRLYLLAVRQIKSGIRSERIRKKLRVESKLLCLGYRVIVKSFERTGDHLKNIAKSLLLVEDSYQKEKLERIASKSFGSFKKSVKSLFQKDGQMAERSIQESKEIDKLSRKIDKKQKFGDFSFEIKSIINSIERTRKLSRDIAEIVINLTAEKFD